MAHFVKLVIPCNVSDSFDYKTTLVFIEDEVVEGAACLKINSRCFDNRYYRYPLISVGCFGYDYTMVGMLDTLISDDDFDAMIEEMLSDSDMLDYILKVVDVHHCENSEKVNDWCYNWIKKHNADRK